MFYGIKVTNTVLKAALAKNLVDACAVEMDDAFDYISDLTTVLQCSYVMFHGNSTQYFLLGNTFNKGENKQVERFISKVNNLLDLDIKTSQVVTLHFND